MAGFRLAVLAGIGFVLPTVAADPVKWGPPDNGLRISVSLGGKTDSQDVRAAFENIGGKDILIPLGMIYGMPHPTLLRICLKAANGERPKVVYTGVGVVEEPLTIGLRAGETYTTTLLMDRHYLLDGSEKLATFIRKPCQL